jgi:hypothetical protein
MDFTPPMWHFVPERQQLVPRIIIMKGDGSLEVELAKRPRMLSLQLVAVTGTCSLAVARIPTLEGYGCVRDGIMQKRLAAE